MTKRPARSAPADSSIEPHPVNLDAARSPVKTKRTTAGEQSAKPQPGLPAAHNGRPVRNCKCVCCTTHRRLNRQALKDHALAAITDFMVTGTVRAGQNATDALKRVLGLD